MLHDVVTKQLLIGNERLPEPQAILPVNTQILHYIRLFQRAWRRYADLREQEYRRLRECGSEADSAEQREALKKKMLTQEALYKIPTSSLIRALLEREGMRFGAQNLTLEVQKPTVVGEPVKEDYEHEILCFTHSNAERVHAPAELSP